MSLVMIGQPKVFIHLIRLNYEEYREHTILQCDISKELWSTVNQKICQKALLTIREDLEDSLESSPLIEIEKRAFTYAVELLTS